MLPPEITDALLDWYDATVAYTDALSARQVAHPGLEVAHNRTRGILDAAILKFGDQRYQEGRNDEAKDRL